MGTNKKTKDRVAFKQRWKLLQRDIYMAYDRGCAGCFIEVHAVEARTHHLLLLYSTSIIRPRWQSNGGIDDVEVKTTVQTASKVDETKCYCHMACSFFNVFLLLSCCCYRALEVHHKTVKRCPVAKGSRATLPRQRAEQFIAWAFRVNVSKLLAVSMGTLSA